MYLVWLLILMVLPRSVYHILVSLFITVMSVTVISFFFFLIPEIQQPEAPLLCLHQFWGNLYDCRDPREG